MFSNKKIFIKYKKIKNMSFGLGASATCGEMIASKLDVPYVSGLPVKTLTVDDDDTTIAGAKGLYLVDYSGGSTTVSLADGSKSGDVVEILTVRSGGNSFTVNAVIHITGSSPIAFGTVSGGYLRMVWIQDIPGVGNGWFVLDRSSGSPAAATAVANLPAIS